MRVVLETVWLVGAALVLSCSPNEGSSGGSGGSAPGAASATGGALLSAGGALQQGGGHSTSGATTTSGAATIGGASSSSGGAPSSAGSGTSGSNSGGASPSAGTSFGGNVGTGGVTATAGSGGIGGSGAAGASAGPCSAAGLLFCDTFDMRPSGTKPMGAPWLASECFDSAHTLKVDSAQSHSGTQSLVSQGIPYGACMLHADLGGVRDFWVRNWVRFGKGDASQFAAHEVVVYDLTPKTDVDDPGIRVGFRGDNSCIPTGAEVNITGGEEKTGCTGFQFEADKWYCLELHVALGATGVSTDFWIDGVDQSFTIHGMPAQTVDNPNYLTAGFLRLGTRSYSSAYPSPIWVDDIAVGTARIGCN